MHLNFGNTWKYIFITGKKWSSLISFSTRGKLIQQRHEVLFNFASDTFLINWVLNMESYKGEISFNSSGQIKISLGDGFMLELDERYNGLLNNMMAARKLGKCYRSGLQSLSEQQEALINIAVLLQEEFESPSEDDFTKVTTYSLGTSDTDRSNRLQHMIEVIALNIKQIVDFAKRLPGFDTLIPEDQITTLKGSSLEVLLLRLSRKYDVETNSTVFGNNRRYTRDSLYRACMDDFADFIFRFCRTLHEVKVDNTEYALLSAIAIFSSRPLLLEPTKVKKLRDLYMKALKDYMHISRSNGSAYFRWVISTLLEMRNVGKRCAEQWLSVKVNYNRLPPVIEELLVTQKPRFA